MDGRVLESVTSARCSAGGVEREKNKDRDGEIDGWMVDWSLWVSVCAVCGRIPPQFARDCGLTTHTHTH